MTNIPEHEIAGRKHLPDRKVAYIVQDTCPTTPYVLEDEAIEVLFWSREYHLGQRLNYGTPFLFFEYIGTWDEDLDEVNLARLSNYANSGAVLIPVAFYERRYDVVVREVDLDEDFIEEVMVDHHPRTHRAFGVIHISKANVEKHFSSWESAFSQARNAIQLYQNYLNGLVYGVIVEQAVDASYVVPETGENVVFDYIIQTDSCWGFEPLAAYGPELQKELAEMIDDHLGPEADGVEWEWN